MMRGSDWTDVDLVEELDENGQGLTPWEIEFTEAMVKKVRDGIALTERERGKLSQIIEERVG